ncbi:MAG TPA: DNA gyrase subunit B [Phycisphaerales bacterium]|nr:DNA gyrase subunit B [Phycisphaerales bacterium]HMP35915.1 DNA gyrase subunit B [Phycisphaerales bacterium]
MSDRAETPSADAYTSESIQVLEGLEAIRKRPGMYVGGTGLNALHHLVYECVDNSIDEAMAGFATTITIRLGVDGSCTVIDDGRGMPVDPMKHENPAINGRPAVEVIMTEVHAGGKFDDNAYKVSGGLHGVGVKCVNALSEWTEVEVVKERRTHMISFNRGAIVKPLHVVGEAPADSGAPRSGTRISFRPDPIIFPDTEFRFETLQHRLRELAYLNAGVTIRLVDERVDAGGKQREETFHSRDGLRAYVEHLNASKTAVSQCVAFTRRSEDGRMTLELALQYTDATNETLLAFGNNIPNPDGGTHVAGFKTALTRTINAYAKRANLLKDLVPSGEDLREGLTAIVSVRLTEPQFNNQTKEKLLNPEVEGFVSAAVSEAMGAWLEEHPQEARRICLKAILAAQAREAARKARELIKRKGALDSGGMPHKLSDCSSDDVEATELFIVEGDSAGGSAKGGRDHVTQAILPLRGKLLNVEKARLDKVLGFEEIRTLIQALQCGIGEDFDISKLRYGRVIIMTDADVDGSHIRTLLLTFFFRQMPLLVRQGKIFIAQPPLYLVEQVSGRNRTREYVLNERQMADVLADLALRNAVLALRDDAGAVVRRIDGDDLRRLLRAIQRVEELVTVSQRRGIPFAELLAARRSDPEGAERLPTHHLQWPEGELLCWSEAQAREAIERRGLVLDDLGGGAEVDRLRRATLRELHENRELERLFQRLAEFGVSIEDWALVQEESVTGEKLPTRYAWEVRVSLKAAEAARRRAESAAAVGAAEADEPEPDAGDAEGDPSPNEPAGSDGAADRRGATASQPAPSRTELVEAANVPAILRTLHDVGRRGIEVKRFKGLGEMEAEQLWETTMDPARRTLLRVNWESAGEADALFATLMGENVELRRAYIERHALEVKNLDV